MTTVLVIEDDSSQSFLMGMVLNTEGFTTKILDSAFHLALDPTSPIFDDVDVVCCDVTLGDVDGREILRNLKEVRPTIRRIAITGWDIDLSDVADVVLHKVVPLDTIIKAIQG